MLQVRTLLGFGKKSGTSVEGCDECSSRAFNHFCTLCSKRFCADHIDDESKHPCGTNGLTKKQFRQVAKERAWPLNEKEKKAIEFGKKMAENYLKEKEHAKGRSNLAKVFSANKGFR